MYSSVISRPGQASLMACCMAAALLLGLGNVTAAHANKVYATPEAAMTELGDAIFSDDEAAMKSLLGANFRDLIPVVGAGVRYQFLAAWGKSHVLKPTDHRADIAVGDDGWTLPIPLVKADKGWQFDTRAGVEEMRVRRIGRNELAVIQTMLAIHDAQNEYAQTIHDGSHVLAYAAKLSSSPGKHDGLYWPTRPDEPESPLGLGFKGAGTRNASKDGYYGYHYKLLTSQGPHAPGGVFDYVVDGKLFGGFAVIAWPVRYQDTGVMSFMVSHDGQVYERDLGANGVAKAAAMKSFDPGAGWRKVSP